MRDMRLHFSCSSLSMRKRQSTRAPNAPFMCATFCLVWSRRKMFNHSCHQALSLHTTECDRLRTSIEKRALQEQRSPIQSDSSHRCVCVSNSCNHKINSTLLTLPVHTCTCCTTISISQTDTRCLNPTFKVSVLSEAPASVEIKRVCCANSVLTRNAATTSTADELRYKV